MTYLKKQKQNDTEVQFLEKELSVMDKKLTWDKFHSHLLQLDLLSVNFLFYDTDFLYSAVVNILTLHFTSVINRM